MSIKLKFSYLSFSIILIVLIISCSKKDEDLINSNNNHKKDTVSTTDTTKTEITPHIKSIDINKGPYNTLVTIIGANFGNNALNDKVYFNTKQATIISVSDTSIVTRVPLGAGTG